MIPIMIEGATHRMIAPAGQEDEVRTLYARKIEDCYVTRWEPLPEELALLNAGGSVELWCMNAQPPVYLTAAAHAGDEP